MGRDVALRHAVRVVRPDGFVDGRERLSARLMAASLRDPGR